MMKQYIWIGTYTEYILFGTGECFKGKGKGLLLGIFEDGEIELCRIAQTINPSYLCINKVNKKIYAVNETKIFQGKRGGAVTQFSYNINGELLQEACFYTDGEDPCHIASSLDGKCLAMANFASGSLSVFELNEHGNITGKKNLFQHTGSGSHPIRQSGPHAHSAIFSPDGKFLYVPDLGIDCIKAYACTSGKIEPIPEADVHMPSGSGPRYGEFSRDGKHFYLINELSSQVTHFFYHNGKMIEKDSVCTLPDDFTGYNICSDLHLTPDGAFIYASNRGHDSIVCYRINANGELSFVQRISSGGKTPRNFCIDPTGAYLLTGNQDSETVAIFLIQPNGLLKMCGTKYVESPVCIQIFTPGHCHQEL